MAAQNADIAIEMIASLDLTKFADKAIRDGSLKKREREQAMNEYLQHLLLVWFNITKGYEGLILITELAEMIWQKHLDNESTYSLFCENLVGQYIFQDQSLKKDSPAFKKAVEHTQMVHKKFGEGAFYDSYALAVGS